MSRRTNKKRPSGSASQIISWRQILLQLSGILTLGSALGLTFNAGNPLGVRWNEKPADPSLAALTNQPAVSPTPSPTQLPVPPEAAPHAPFNAPTATTWLAIRQHLADQTLVLVDARARPVFEAGHIPGAICVPEDSPAAELEAFRTKYGTNAHVVVYCASTSCSLSFKLAHKLAQDYGFKQVQYLTGGYLEYQRETAQPASVVAATQVGPAIVSSLPPPVAPATSQVPLPAAPTAAEVTAIPAGGSQLNPQPMSWEKVDEWLQARQAVLVDVRSEPAFKNGHVPGALSLPANSSTEKIASFREQVGTNQTVILYGDRAGSMTAFTSGRQLMRDAGFSSVRFVMEGYQEWQTIPANQRSK